MLHLVPVVLSVMNAHGCLVHRTVTNGRTVLVRIGRPAVLDNPVLRRNGTLWALRILVVCWGYDLDVSLATRLLQQSAQ